MTPFEYADATFGPGSLLLTFAEGSLLLMSSSFRTLRGAVRNRDLLHAPILQFGLVSRRVEPCVAGHQLWNTPELLFMLLHCRHQQVRIMGPLLEHLIVGYDLVLRFLNLDHLSKLGRLARFPLSDHFRARLKYTHQFPRYVDSQSTTKLSQSGSSCPKANDGHQVRSSRPGKFALKYKLSEAGAVRLRWLQGQ
jgi:hypothetical protein